MYTAQSGTEGDDVLTGSSAQPCVCMYSARPKAMYAIRTPMLSSVLSSGRHAAEQATARPIETRHQTTAAGQVTQPVYVVSDAVTSDEALSRPEAVAVAYTYRGFGERLVRQCTVEVVYRVLLL
jgi:hypothetical protein